MARVPLTSSLIADPLLGPDRSLLQLAVLRPADRRNRPAYLFWRRSLRAVERRSTPWAGARSAPTQAEWAVVALEATWTRPRGFVAL